MRDKLISVVQDIVSKLAVGDFEGVEFLTRKERMTAEEMKQAIEEYGRTLVDLPQEGLRALEFTRIRSATPSKWSVAVPLWTEEEGRSDLTLELTLTEEQTWTKIELDDIHVL